MIELLEFFLAVFAIAMLVAVFICVAASCILSSRISQEIERRKEDL